MPTNITYEDIKMAHEGIREQIHCTPVLTCSYLDSLAGKYLFFKCENFQKIGAFKFRGVSNSVNKLTKNILKRGLVTHSSGNHAQAVALAAKLRGIPAYIIMPNNASAIKRSAVVSYGGTIFPCESTLEDRENITQKVIEKTGAHFIHPYNDPDVIAGQGTVALELLQQVHNLDAIIVPVGGGGLLSGTCLVASHIKPAISVYGAEPKGADYAWRSLKAGRLIPQDNPQTIADGLHASLGTLTWDIIQQHVNDIVTVSETEIIEAIRLVWERAKIVVEASAAVGLAGVLTTEFKKLPHERIGVILTGGNIDLENSPLTPALSDRKG